MPLPGLQKSHLGVCAKSSRMTIDYGFHRTPLGRCLLGISVGSVCYLAFVTTGDRELLEDLAARWPGADLHEEPEATGEMIERIFNDSNGDGFELLVGGTSLQVDVWQALLGIPEGTVCSYADIAERVGRPKATRAVGTAIGANPIAWLIPCHRVVRSDGGLGGYRWGIERKKACLDFEKQHLRT